MKMTTSFEQDKRIIAQLRKDSRASLSRISQRIGVPISTVFDRVKQLRGQAIAKFTCIVDFRRLGLDAHSFAVFRGSKPNQEAFCTYLGDHANVNSVYRINHRHDFLVELVFKDIVALEDFIEKTDQLFATRPEHIFDVVDVVNREEVLSPDSTSSIANEGGLP